MKNIFNKENIVTLLLGIVFGVVLIGTFAIPLKESRRTQNKVSIFTDTLVLENQGEIDLYAVDDGRWLVISLDDLKYIVKKKRKTIIPNLESLFERFEVPEKINIKPTFK